MALIYVFVFSPWHLPGSIETHHSHTRKTKQTHRDSYHGLRAKIALGLVVAEILKLSVRNFKKGNQNINHVWQGIWKNKNCLEHYSSQNLIAQWATRHKDRGNGYKERFFLEYDWTGRLHNTQSAGRTTATGTKPKVIK